jgi:hypothetical protein
MQVIMHANLTSILMHNSTFDHDFSIVTILLIILGLKDHSRWRLLIGYNHKLLMQALIFHTNLALFIMKDPCKLTIYCFESLCRLLIYLSKENHMVGLWTIQS